MADGPHLLVVDAPYYTEISASLMEGVAAVLDKANSTYDYIAVPGVLEVPAAIAMAVRSSRKYDGYIAIGCVIRGETTHYEIVSNESARAIMDLAVTHGLAIGNGIQTVENEAQAWARAKPSEKNKGGGAAEAALGHDSFQERKVGTMNDTGRYHNTVQSSELPRQYKRGAARLAAVQALYQMDLVRGAAFRCR